jgi:hypothetical protein
MKAASGLLGDGGENRANGLDVASAPSDNPTAIAVVKG